MKIFLFGTMSGSTLWGKGRAVKVTTAVPSTKGSSETPECFPEMENPSPSQDSSFLRILAVLPSLQRKRPCCLFLYMPQNRCSVIYAQPTCSKLNKCQ